MHHLHNANSSLLEPERDHGGKDEGKSEMSLSCVGNAE